MKDTNVFETLGNVELLSQNKIAVFSSRNTPPDIIQSCEPFFIKLLTLPISLAGGWQSAAEKSLYKMAQVYSKANIIHYIAKDINQFKPGEQQQNLLDHNKLLIISPGLKEDRVSAPAVEKRDRLVFAQNKNILFLYIEPGGRLYHYFQELSRLNYQLFILDHPRNETYFFDGISPVNEDSIRELLLI